MPGRLIKCHAPLVADYIERTSGVGAAGRVQPERIVAMKPLNPKKPAEGPLMVTRWCDVGMQAGEEQQGVVGSSSSNSSSYGVGIGGAAIREENSGKSSSSSGPCRKDRCIGSFLQGDEVPATVLPLLVHIFQEQMPVICSTLQLLQQWIQQQQLVNVAASEGQGSRRMGEDGWKRLPRSLGNHNFKLYDPVTGRVAAEGSRASSAYLAWRAVQLAQWYDAFADHDKEGVKDVLQLIDEKLSRESRTQGSVDAAGTFSEILRLARGCGRVERHGNRVVIRLNFGKEISKL